MMNKLIEVQGCSLIYIGMAKDFDVLSLYVTAGIMQVAKTHIYTIVIS